ncbi:MAG: peptidoglycan-binding domain-containing protein, partial [Anaerolineales bacterium]
MIKRSSCLFLWLILSTIFTACSPKQVEMMPTETPLIAKSATTTVTLNKPSSKNTATLPSATQIQATKTKAFPPPTITTTKADFILRESTLFSGDVLALEQRLQSMRYSETGIIDGIYDQQTRLAVQHLQWLNGLPITG